MVENSYVGVSCGKLDQSTEVYSKKDHLMYLDTDTDEVRLIPRAENMRNYEIGVFFSGVSRSLAKTGYNMRVDECKAAAYALKAFDGIEYHKFNDTYLREVPYDVFEKYKSRLPVNWMKRAQHFYSENARAKRGAKLWEEGDLYGFGKLISESGHSSIYSYETGSNELKTLYEGLLRTDGVYGTRFSGAGFEGCCMAVVDPKYKEEITRKVTNYYLKEFPKLSDAFEVHYCSTADGVEF
jgi:galactokinase/galacturonokinase